MNTMINSSKEKKNYKKILIIEDEPDICFLLNIILKDNQIDLEHVNTLAQAKLFLKEQTPSLVFLDNSLPDGRGSDFITYIKATYPAIKVVMITGFNSNSEKNRAINNGADLFLTKPFTRVQIKEAVQQLLEIDPMPSS